MLAYSQYHCPMELGANNLSLFDFLRKTRFGPKNRIASKSHISTSAKEMPEHMSTVVPNGASKPKQRKTVRFSETVHVRTFRSLPMEQESVTRKPSISQESYDGPFVSFPPTKINSAIESINQLSYIQSPYFQAFEASRGLITIPSHYCI